MLGGKTMLKYVALLKVDQPELWSVWHSGPTARYFKSPIETDKEKVEQWLRDELKKYPNARVNNSTADKKYIIYTTIIAFNEKESENVERFLEKCIPFYFD